jgi:heme exporter protein C
MSERVLGTPPEAKLPAGAPGPCAAAGPDGTVFTAHGLLDRRLSAALGCLALTALVVLGVLGLWVAPPDAVQGDAQRLMYLHVPTAWLAYLAFGVTALSSALWLWPRTRSAVWDRMAGSSAELGVVFTGLTLVLGSLWGRPVWGIWWAWDARLVTTAVLFFLYLGYLALRRIPGTGRERRCAIAALVAFVDVPVVHFSVEWWRTLHQEATVFNPELSADIHGSMAVTLWWGVFAFTVLYVYLLDRRYRLEALDEDRDRRELERAIAQRLSEAEVARRRGVGVGAAR